MAVRCCADEFYQPEYGPNAPRCAGATDSWGYQPDPPLPLYSPDYTRPERSVVYYPVQEVRVVAGLPLYQVKAYGDTAPRLRLVDDSFFADEYRSEPRPPLYQLDCGPDPFAPEEVGQDGRNALAMGIEYCEMAAERLERDKEPVDIGLHLLQLSHATRRLRNFQKQASKRGWGRVTQLH